MRLAKKSAKLSDKPSCFEPLENRRLYSASAGGFMGPQGGGPPSGGPGGGAGASIEFSLAPSAVQSGLDSLASADHLTAPAATDPVQLGNQSGVETYSVTINSTGTVSRLTVDASGAPITAPTQTATTYGDLQTSDAAAATGLSAIVTADNATALTSTDTINVITASDGTVTYSLPPAAPTTSSSTTSMPTPADGAGRGPVSVDANGVAVGNQTVAFSVLPTAIQNGLNAGAPSGATALTSASTQDVRVQTVDGVVLYSTVFTVSGTRTTVTVDKAGAAAAASLPTSTTADFSTIPTAAQAELQALATAEGSTDTISATASVTVYTEATGTVLCSLKVSVADATTASSSSTTGTHDVTLTVDAAGNPTVLPAGDLGAPGTAPRGLGSGGNQGGSGNGDCPQGTDPTTGSTSPGSSGSTGTGLTAGSGGSTPTPATARAAKAAARKAKAAAAKAAKLAAATARKAAKAAALAAKKAATASA